MISTCSNLLPWIHIHIYVVVAMEINTRCYDNKHMLKFVTMDTYIYALVAMKINMCCYENKY